MVNKYIKYLPWMILGAFPSYQSATYYARNSFDLFYLTLNFLIVYIAFNRLLRKSSKRQMQRTLHTNHEQS